MISRVPLDDVCDKKIETLSSHYDGKIEYIDISSIDNVEKIISNTQIIDSKEAPSRAKQLVKNGDILVSTVRPNLNAVAVIEKESDYVLVASTGYCVLRCNSEFNNHYVFHFCQSPYFVEDMVKQATGASYPAVSNSIVKSCLMPLRSLEEQKRIATVLDKVSDLIALRKQQLAKLDELVKARFAEMFGDSKTNPKRWVKKRLETIAFVGSSKRVFVEELQDTGIPFYRGTEIGALATGETVIPELFITEKHYNELCTASGTPKRGDLLMPSICPDGRIWCVDTDEPFYFKDGRVLWIHPTDNIIESTYLLYALKEKIISDYINIASGTTFAELKIFALKGLEVMIPPLPSQKSFSDFIQAVHTEQLTIQQGLDKLEIMKKALMQQYFE